MQVLEKKLFTALLLAVLVVLGGGFVYHALEQWSWIDSFYFASATVTTVGFGDLRPTHEATKIFTIFYMFTGISIVFYAITAFGEWYIERYAARRAFNPRDAIKLLKEKKGSSQQE
ncbi:MAG: potassium channel family protein [Candidatus Micrarchaeia archaeon]|jgi:hypothetical protein